MIDMLQTTAKALATRAVPTAAPDEAVAQVLINTQAFSTEYDTIDYIYILTDGHLVGVVSLHELFSLPPEQRMQACMTTKLATVSAQTDQETVAHLALAENIKAVPVIDKEGVFLGVVTADKILQILRDEHTEDILTYAGITFTADEKLADYTIPQHYVSRIPWLLLGLGGGIVAAWVVEQFSVTIAREIALAAFIPAIVYIADAVGSQTQMVYVRSLSSTKQTSLSVALRRELIIASAVGLTLASAIGALSYVWLQSTTVPVILFTAVLATVYFSVLVAIVLPWLFHRAGHDPAVATGPLATVIRDVSSLCIYFVIALLLL